MNKTITVEVRNKVAAQTNRVEYVCGNNDFLIDFDFDDEWAAFDVKTARFIHNGTHIDVVFRGNQCAVPVMSDTHRFNVGVFAGDLRTTTAAYIPAKKSILCDAGVPADPMPDVYNQIMDRVNEVAEDALKPVGWDDIENRPFYEEKALVELLPITEIEFDYSTKDIKVDFALVLGNQYTVHWNGTKYECIAASIEDDWVSLAEDGLFTIEQQSGSNKITVYVHDESTSAELGIYETNEILKPIDPKFLPETVVTDEEMAQAMEGLATEEYVNRATTGLASETFVEQAIREAEQDDFSGSWNDLNDKPFYEESGAIEIFPETELEYDSDMDFFPLPDLELVVGDTYIVTWNGTEHKCVAWVSDDGYENIFLGNDDYPFLICATAGEAFSYDGSTTATLRICHVIDIQFLDPNFLPKNVVTDDELAHATQDLASKKYVNTAVSGLRDDLSMLIGECATMEYVDEAVSGLASEEFVEVAVKDLASTEYVDQAVKEVNANEIFPETALEYNADMEIFHLSVELELIVGDTYIVTWNGKKYECVAYAIDVGGYEHINLGGDSYPFSIEATGDAYSNDGATAATLRIAHVEKVVTKAELEQAINDLPTETWTFTLDDGTVIEKKVVVAT